MGYVPILLSTHPTQGFLGTGDAMLSTRSSFRVRELAAPDWPGLTMEGQDEATCPQSSPGGGVHDRAFGQILPLNPALLNPGCATGSFGDVPYLFLF